MASRRANICETLICYLYDPGTGWRRIADLPQPRAGAPSPAPALGRSRLLVLGGDDGSQIAASPERHTGFSRDVLAYHTIADTWTKMGELPFSLVTTPATEWNGRIVIPGGETQPGERSPQIWSGEPVR